MKVYLLTLAVFCFTTTGYSLVNDITDKIFPRELNGKLKFSMPGEKWLAENMAGKAYSLPLDNMPCLVPDIKNQIRITTKKLNLGNSKMPNKIPK